MNLRLKINFMFNNFFNSQIEFTMSFSLFCSLDDVSSFVSELFRLIRNWWLWRKEKKKNKVKTPDMVKNDFFHRTGLLLVPRFTTFRRFITFRLKQPKRNKQTTHWQSQNKEMFASIIRRITWVPEKAPDIYQLQQSRQQQQI